MQLAVHVLSLIALELRVNVVATKCEADNLGFMFMFRRKRNCLAKRLWKARVLRKGHEIRGKDEILDYYDEDSSNNDDRSSNCGAGCCALSDEGLLRNAVLKRLKDNQLEMLVEAVESGGAGVSTCVLVPKDIIENPHLLCCQIWRWPDLRNVNELRRTPACPSASDPIYICCNPYHWSRLCEPESPPPPYSRFAKEKLKPEDRAPSKKSPLPSSVNANDNNNSNNAFYDYDYDLVTIPRQIYNGRPYHRHCHHYHHPPTEFNGSLSTNGESEQNENEWCKLAYWELSQRVGRLYPVQNTAVNIFWTDIHGDGLSLETLAHHSFSPPDSVHRNRSKIGLGITLSSEDDGVWVYNRSKWPIFVNSPTLDDLDCRSTFLVYRVPAGHCFRVFSPGLRKIPPGYWSGPLTGPMDPNTVRISFAKGWGPKYSRQEITSCPTWIEILLSPCR